MARLASSAAHFCQRLQELYPQKLAITTKQQSEQSSPFRRWTTGSGAGSSYRHHDHRNMYNKQMSEGSTPVSSSANGGSSNVARWSLGLEQLLADPNGAAAFSHFLAKEFASENLRFWRACEQYRSLEDGGKRVVLAGEIWQRHLDDKASEPVNVDASARRATALALYQDPPPPDLFQQAQRQIFNVMKFDSYQRFLHSPEHAECARADLCGLPCPFAPVQDSHGDSPTKLKKSASNASERRRSGGSSLLPWKLRHASRDRLAASDSAPVADVVKSSQSAPGQLLCRVVLPDGATSVVGVEAAVSVARLVERLLQRRNLACNTYDVTLKEPAQGESPTIDIQSPSTVLGGREVLVERRAVIRLELGSRCVAVRCRAQRRLRHVLRPVLHKYCLSQPRHVLRDGHLVHPDTIMQELDGCRLQVVEVSECGDFRAESARSERDSDADSMSDVAVRQDGDLHSQNTSAASSRSNSGTSSMCSGGVAVNGVGGVVNGVGGVVNGVGGVVNGGGRVRAALRPGPPLHHHPPDFLENLRETQRQRFQSRDPPSPLGTPPCLTPAPRTPPPLPPKPQHRPAPTVV